MEKALVLLALGLVLALFPAEAARADELVVETPTEEASFPFFCDWGYDWEERCYWDTWSPRLSIGGDRDKVWRAGLRFALSQVPAGSDVGRARLFLYHDRVCVGVYGSTRPCDGRRWDLEVVPILGEWFDEREPDLGFPSAWLTIDAGALEGWVSFDVTDLVTEWVRGSLERDGMLVKLVDAQEVFLGSGPSPPGRLYPDPARRPRLEVEFLPPANSGLDTKPRAAQDTLAGTSRRPKFGPRSLQLRTAARPPLHAPIARGRRSVVPRRALSRAAQRGRARVALAEVSSYDAVADLPVEVDACVLERLSLQVSSGFTRVTTLIRLHGAGEEGVGEDVTYDAVEHDDPPVPDLAGRWDSFDELSGALGRLQLFRGEPSWDAFLSYRRWGYESAALDLALRQAGTSLAEALGRDPRPVTFVVSMRLGDPPTIEPLLRWLDLYPGLRFKLDPTSGWDEPLVEELVATGAVDSVDLKGAYRGTPVDQAPDPALYRLVAEAFPDAWIEDPAIEDERTAAVLEPHRHRITWDAPIHSVGDIEALPFEPRMLNVKPSRFGSVRSLLQTYDWCAERDISVYGGGQFELAVGRGQIQYLASLFHPDTPNDVAPGGFNMSVPKPGLPTSPLEPQPAPTGFRWGQGPVQEMNQGA